MPAPVARRRIMRYTSGRAMRRSVSCCVFPLTVRKRGVRLPGRCRGLDVGEHILFPLVMRRDLVALAALLMESNPPTVFFVIPIFDIHAGRHAYARDG